jgi:hypothetical protein
MKYLIYILVDAKKRTLEYVALIIKILTVSPQGIILKKIKWETAILC